MQKYQANNNQAGKYHEVEDLIHLYISRTAKIIKAIEEHQKHTITPLDQMTAPIIFNALRKEYYERVIEFYNRLQQIDGYKNTTQVDFRAVPVETDYAQQDQTLLDIFNSEKPIIRISVPKPAGNAGGKFTGNLIHLIQENYKKLKSQKIVEIAIDAEALVQDTAREATNIYCILAPFAFLTKKKEGDYYVNVD